MLIRRIHVTGGPVRRAARRPRYQSPPASRVLPPGPASRTVKYDTAEPDRNSEGNLRSVIVLGVCSVGDGV